VMSIGWMALIAALIATEKLLPWRAVANRGIAVFLAVLGIAVAFAPEDVPGLTLPDSPEAAQAMEAMGMEEEGGSMGEKPAAGMSDDKPMDDEMNGGSSGGGMNDEQMP
jgi:hypothetical protein